MYFSIGWPRVLNSGPHGNIQKVVCDRVKILFAVLTDDAIAIWYSKPCVPITSKIRSAECLSKYGANTNVEWKPDSSMLLVVTRGTEHGDGTLFMYTLIVNDTPKGVYNQNDSPFANLRRDSAELFLKEAIPCLKLSLTHRICLYVPICCVSCINVNQIVIATQEGRIVRLNWEGVEERDYALDLKRIPFSINQQVSYAVPILEKNVYVASIDYSPLLCGFGITLSDGRAAFLTANNTKFDPNQVQGIWCQNVDDATCTVINHKYRLIAFGRKNSQTNMYVIDDLTGGLELSHRLSLSAKDFPGSPGYVRDMKWTPDGCAIIVAWANGGISLWSTFGSLLLCSLAWDYGLHVDLAKNDPFNVISMDWSTEGYQLLMVRKTNEKVPSPTSMEKDEKPVGNASDATGETLHEEQYLQNTVLVQLDFVKSILTINPCMSNNSFLLLQGDDKLYINHGDVLQNIYPSLKATYDSTNENDSSYSGKTDDFNKDPAYIASGEPDPVNVNGDSYLKFNSVLSESKHWVVLNLPTAYISSNWPIRYSAIDHSGTNVAVAGRTGVALYAFNTRKWKLFGNETQEKDFVITGGLLWWKEFIIMGCYSLIGFHDELRIYSKETKLDNRFAVITKSASPVMLINLFRDQLVVFTSDGHVSVFALKQTEEAYDGNDQHRVELVKMHIYDIKNVCIHPACVISVLMTSLKHEGIGSGSMMKQSNSSYENSLSETLIMNVSGRVLMVQTDHHHHHHHHGSGGVNSQLTSTCLASSVECIWVSESSKTHIKESLWLYCGGYGMRVWLPVFPRTGETGSRSLRHTFMSKRIMLSFTLKIYPLVILFEDAIILGAENDTLLYTSDPTVYFSLPYNALKRTSQVYLHQILRQLIRRNLGYNAWEIARCCTDLPYFPHSLELLLHEVLEEEATSKEPIPDALLPSVLEFIQEFPVYLQTVVQCARKTEIALWPYLFSSAGKPKELFQKCMAARQLHTAASYLIILQNLEPSSVSRQYATLLLDTALELRDWPLAKDLVRFLRAIDPNDVESPRSSYVFGNKFGGLIAAGPPTPNAEDLSLILGSSMARGRSFSTTVPYPKPTDGAATVVNKEKNIMFNSPAPAVALQQGGSGLSANNESAVNGQVLRRKKSVPNTQKERDSSSAEEFFIDVVLQRHARRFLQLRKLEDLGYMSATLDFHLVGWLNREKDRAARIEDFVTALKNLHDELDWPKPCLDLTLLVNPLSPPPTHPESSPSPSSNQSNKSPLSELATRRTVDSGYNSLSFVRPGDGTVSGTVTGALQEHPASKEAKQLSAQQDKEQVNGASIVDESSTAEANLMPLNDAASVRSETAQPNWPDDMPTVCGTSGGPMASLTLGDQSFNQALEKNISKQSKTNRRKEHKLEIRMRYLLQIFTEANCYEFSLLLSVLLLDVASVGRITNAAIRSKSLVVCRQLRNGLKDMTRWSFNECLAYRPFMIALQPQLAVLDKFVIQQESIPSLIHPTGAAAALSPLATVNHMHSYRHGTDSMGSGGGPVGGGPSAIGDPRGSGQHDRELGKACAGTSLHGSVQRQNSGTLPGGTGSSLAGTSQRSNVQRDIQGPRYTMPPHTFARSVSDLEVANIRKIAQGKPVADNRSVASAVITEEPERTCSVM
ncbi:guanine nucleotide exchange factor subunit Rich [Anopheles ziemanni]|uniref:guanine nucleotide exchange factor subunit Rich n=1 Tax=Anopheles coustani TaxID=139045 RepID=UPI002658A98C|nr:guanine nucleotide exchange factor subunit Rich [Anopheles coustani]XP_058167966.1 guanine nucleotide exchange factor subunit Rich [Anopheles ziemanni]